MSPNLPIRSFSDWNCPECGTEGTPILSVAINHGNTLRVTAVCPVDDTGCGAQYVAYVDGRNFIQVVAK